MTRLLTTRVALLGLLLIALLSACGGAEPTPTAPADGADAEPTPTPAEIMSRAGDAMNAVESARFTMNRSGGPAYLDADQILNFSSAEGVYQAPASIDAVLSVSTSGAAIQINTIAIGDEQWITNPVNQRWEQLPPDWGFNPAILFDEQLGWKPLLQEDIVDAALLDTSTFGGVTRYRLQATASGPRVSTITGGVAGDQTVELEVLVDPATYLIVQLSFETISSSGEPSQWLLKFSDFDAPVTIERPPTG